MWLYILLRWTKTNAMAKSATEMSKYLIDFFQSIEVIVVSVTGEDTSDVS